MCVCEHNCLHTYKTWMEDTQDIGALVAFENGAKLGGGGGEFLPSEVLNFCPL